MSWNIKTPGDYINGPLTVVGDVTFGSNLFKTDTANNVVGIGTGTPNSFAFNGPAKLVVANNANASDYCTLTIASGASGIGYIAFAKGTSGTNRYNGQIQYNHILDFMSFHTAAGAERARFNSTGAFVLAGGTQNGNGIGIAFPGTQSASTDANTLDDYEEGTWTPVYTPQSGAYGALGAVNTGYYRKIGDTVFIWGSVRTTGTPNLGTASGNLYISGLPFPVTSVEGGNGQISIMQQFNLSSSFNNIGVIFEVSQSRLYLTKNSSNASVAYVQATELNTATQSFGNLLGFFGMYRV